MRYMMMFYEDAAKFAERTDPARAEGYRNA